MNQIENPETLDCAAIAHLVLLRREELRRIPAAISSTVELVRQDLENHEFGGHTLGACLT